jgi:predicted ester cyclase
MKGVYLMTEEKKMTLEEKNKEILIRIIEEGYNQRKLHVSDELIAEDFLDHNPMDGQGEGREGWKDTVRMAMRNMPDLRIELHEVIAEGDLVFFLGTIHGTNTEPLEHLGIPATNKKIAVQNMNLMRIKDGKGTERWLLRDEKAMAQQLGLIPGPD